MMKRFALHLIFPVVIFAQVVEMDTVIVFPTRIWTGWYTSEFDKLYIASGRQLFAVHCSSYQIDTIPLGLSEGRCSFSWNWREKKLYLTGLEWRDSVIVVVDAQEDTILKRIFWPSPRGHCYVSVTNRMYIVGKGVLKILDCTTDSIITEKEPPITGYEFKYPCWDSVHNKLYIGMGKWNSPEYFAVYDCTTDSLLALIRVPIMTPFGMQFSYRLDKGYFAGDMQSFLGVIDIKNDSFLKFFPIFIEYAELVPFALDTIDDKVYCGRAMPTYPDTIYVIDCVTDSIIKKLVEGGLGPLSVRWSYWTNRVYFTGGPQGETLKVLDCQTDSIIARIYLEEFSYCGPPHIVLDPIHHRIFAIGQDSTLYVLRELISGVEEGKAGFKKVLFPTVVRDILFLPNNYITKKEVYLLDVAGRKVLELVPGGNDVRHIAPGVYFIRAGGSLETRRVVITR